AAVRRIEKLPEPCDLLLVRPIRARSLLVAPVRGHTELGVLVHLVRAYLELDGQLLGADDRRMQGAVAVALRRRDVVVELAGDVRPETMDDAERGIAVRDGVDEDPDRTQIVELLERQALALHLAPDAVEVLRPAGHARADPGLLERGRDDRDHVLDVALAVSPLRGEPRRDAPIVVRLEVSEREVLELPLELPDPEPARERRVDLARLERETLALVGRPVLH